MTLLLPYPLEYQWLSYYISQQFPKLTVHVKYVFFPVYLQPLVYFVLFLVVFFCILLFCSRIVLCVSYRLVMLFQYLGRMLEKYFQVCRHFQLFSFLYVIVNFKFTFVGVLNSEIILLILVLHFFECYSYVGDQRVVV